MEGQSASLLPAILGGAALGLYAAMIRPALDSRRWRFALDLSRGGLIFGALGVIVLLLIFRNNLMMAGIIIVAVLVHEYGHVLAYRLAGHPRPVFRLAPFGGVAFSDRPPASQAENAYIALMGPGFSIAFLVLLLLIHWATRVDYPFVSGLAFLSAGIVGALNFFNLLPFFPLDGGRTMRSVATAAGPRVAFVATLVMSGALAGIGVYLNSWILIILALIGLMAAQQQEKEDLRLPPMPGGQAALALTAYLAVAAAHAAAAAPLMLALLGPLIEAATPPAQ